MTLAETLLQKLSKWIPAAGRQELTVSDAEPGVSVQLTADRKDDVGCLLWELTVQRTAGDLREWAEAIVGRVTGLLEPLKLIELDATRNEALLRSASAATRGDKLHYYELLLRGGNSASLRRYQAGHEGKRDQIPFALTNEMIVKVAADIAEA